MNTIAKVMDAFYRYGDKFGVMPDVTIVRMSDEIGEPFVKVVEQAIQSGKPATAEDWERVEKEVFQGLYDKYPT